MNYTDITAYEGLSFICNYWMKNTNKEHCDSIIVGDVHGDFHQYIAPLVNSGNIKLTGGITNYYIDRDVNVWNFDSKQKIITESKSILPDNIDAVFLIPVPNFSIEKGCRTIFLGDLISRGMFGRSILLMTYLIMRESSNIEFLLGNHELRLIGEQTFDYENWRTVIGEIGKQCPNLKLTPTTAFMNGNELEGVAYVKKYYTPFIKLLTKMFQYFKISTVYNNLLVSHCVLTKSALKELSNIFYPTDLDELSNLVNSLVHSSTNIWMSKNKLTRNRTGTPFIDQIVGHTPGGSMRVVGINSGDSLYFDERNNKCNGTIINGHTIYYFDFGASYAMHEDEISYPDYVVANKSKFAVSNLSAFMFEYNDLKQERSLLILPDKTKYTQNIITVMKEPHVGMTLTLKNNISPTPWISSNAKYCIRTDAHKAGTAIRIIGCEKLGSIELFNTINEF